MIEQRARFARVRDRSVFVGDPDDVVDGRLRPRACRSIRDWTEENFDFAGYVTGFDPAEVADGSERLRGELGCRDRTSGCAWSPSAAPASARSLLRRVLDAVPLAREAAPELRFVVVTGPRIDPRLAAARARGRRCAATCPTCTGTSPPATSPSCRAA